MAIHVVQSPPGIALVTCPNIYRFGGFTFDFHNYLGPWPVRKDLEPVKRFPGKRSRFWPVFERWQKLTKAQKRKTLIYS